VAQKSLTASLVSEEGEVLAFANISAKDGRVFSTNENGYFRISNIENIDTICFSYIGYESKCLAISEVNEAVVLKQSLAPIDTISIRSKGADLHKRIYKILKGFKKKSYHKYDSKCFVSRKTFLTENLAEHTECFYSTSLNTLQPVEFIIKQGKSESYKGHSKFVDSNSLLTLFSWNYRTPQVLYPTALSLSLKKMRNEFEIKWIEYKLLNNIKHAVYELKALSDRYFSTRLIVNTENQQIVELSFYTEFSSTKDFKDLTGKPVTIDKLELAFSFDFHDNKYWIKNSQVNLNYIFEGSDNLNSNNYYFYDINRPFEKDITELEFTYNDYSNICRIPYSEKFWDKQDYVSYLDSVSFCQNRYLEPHEINSFDLLTDKPVDFLNDKILVSGEYLDHSLFAYVFFHIGKFEKNGIQYFEVFPIVDLRRSFAVVKSPLAMEYLKKELSQAELLAVQFEEALNHLNANFEKSEFDRLWKQFDLNLKSQVFFESPHWKIDWSQGQEDLNSRFRSMNFLR